MNPMDLFNLQGTTSVVVGGNGVLGSAMVEALAAYGSQVANRRSQHGEG